MKLSKKIYIFILIIIFYLLISPKVFASAPNINSKSAILVENSTGNILYEKKANEKMYPASTTKIMTAILTIEKCNLDEIAVVSENAVKSVPAGYTNAKLVPGEKILVKDLLYALMLNSANEAANVLAEHISGSVEDFAILMNKKAKSIGCENTNFLNANGMHNDNHYTTAEDLALITKYAMENESFRKIVSTVEYPLPATEQYPKEDRIMKNTNLLIKQDNLYYYPYAIGVKTGYTKQAGNCLVSFAEKDGIELICVTLKADSTNDSTSFRFNDNKSLLEYGFENFSNRKIFEKDEKIQTVEISNATKETKNVNVLVKNSVFDYISNDLDIENIAQKKININTDLKAPIYSGDVIGSITYIINDKTYTSELIAGNTAYTAHNYGSYILVIGLIILTFAIIIMPKKKTDD